MMRMNVCNMLRQAAAVLEDENGHSEGGYAFCLRELAKHLAVLAREPHRWPEFAELYCLKAEELKGTNTDA